VHRGNPPPAGPGARSTLPASSRLCQRALGTLYLPRNARCLATQDHTFSSPHTHARATGLKRRGAVAVLSVTHYIQGGLNPERGDLHHANPPSKIPTHRHARPVLNL